MAKPALKQAKPDVPMFQKWLKLEPSALPCWPTLCGCVPALSRFLEGIMTMFIPRVSISLSHSGSDCVHHWCHPGRQSDEVQVAAYPPLIRVERVGTVPPNQPQPHTQLRQHRTPRGRDPHRHFQLAVASLSHAQSLCDSQCHISCGLKSPVGRTPLAVSSFTSCRWQWGAVTCSAQLPTVPKSRHCMTVTARQGMEGLVQQTSGHMHEVSALTLLLQ